MNCPYCEAPTERRYCCAVCRLADQAELAHFRRPYLSELREPEAFPNFYRELRSILLAARAMTHRVEDMQDDVTPYYEHGGIVIYHGDCREILPHLPNVDLLLTDPPYGVGLGSGDMRRNGHGLGKVSYAGYIDSIDNLRGVVIPAVKSALAMAQRGIVFSGPHMWEYPPADVVGGIYCPSGVGRHQWGFNTFFPVLFYGTDPNLHTGARGGTVLQSTATADANGHPCPKPVEWMRWLIVRGTCIGELILDPFMGSGTTLVAAKMLGLYAIGIEIEERYCEIAARRLTQEVLPFNEPAEPLMVQESLYG